MRTSEDRHSLLQRNTLGSRLKMCRLRNIMQPIEIADEIGITKQSLYRYERDERVPDAYTLERFAKLFQTSIEWLLRGDNNIEKEGNKHGKP